MSFARVALQGARSLRTLGHNERTIASTRTAAPAFARLAQPFSTSPAHLKKRKPDTPSKSSSPAGSSTSGKSKSSPSSSKSSGSDEFDPLDLDPVSAAFAESDAHFQTQVQTVLHGGRFNPSHLGALPVTVKSADASAGSTSAETFPLRELAQVVPRAGRTVSLLVNEKAYVKPIMSAVQSSPDFNQQPQRSDDNELELLLRVEAERPEDLERRVREATQAWRERVRQARTRHDKLLKEAHKSGALLPDTLKKVEKEVQKLQDKKMKEIDALEAQSVKQVGRH